MEMAVYNSFSPSFNFLFIMTILDSLHSRQWSVRCSYPLYILMIQISIVYYITHIYRYYGVQHVCKYIPSPTWWKLGLCFTHIWNSGTCIITSNKDPPYSYINSTKAQNISIHFQNSKWQYTSTKSLIITTW